MTQDNKVIKQYIKDINFILDDMVEKDSRDIMLIFDDLLKKEAEFAKILATKPFGRKCYTDFIRFVVQSKGGINTAKTFFRLREVDAVRLINSAIRKNQSFKLHNLPINHSFCVFCMDKITIKQGNFEIVFESIAGKHKKLDSIFEAIKRLRDEIITRHLYLSLNRAKVFNSGAHTGNELEDLVQVANEALISSVDKFVINEDSSTFQQMAIGKMLAGLISQGYVYSSAHFGPAAKKKIYKIRRAMQENPEMSTDALAKVLNIAEEEINALLSASNGSEVSLDQNINGYENKKYADTITEESEEVVCYEETDAIDAMTACFDKLTIIEQKVLKLKGVKIDENTKYAHST